MPSADTVIVDFNALDSAINKFHATSGQISALEGSLQSNASSLQGAWRSNASDTYAQKMSALVANFNKASENLETEVAELQRLCDLEKEAERTAKGIADSVSDYTMD